MFADMKSFLRRYWKTILWCLTMFYMLFSPGSALPKPEIKIPHFDKLVHAGMFAILVFLFQLDSYKTPKARFKVVLLIISVLLFGSLSEYIQFAYIPGRSGTINDLIADVTGIALGLLLFNWLGERVSGFFAKD